MDEDFYDDYRDSLVEYGNRVDEAWMDLAQERLDDEVESRRLKGSAGINPKFDVEPVGKGRDAA
jgi:hypothetical protein